jgi:MFS family permease
MIFGWKWRSANGGRDIISGCTHFGRGLRNKGANLPREAPSMSKTSGIDHAEPSAISLRALDWLNIFLADVRDGVGPYLAIYLTATHHWDAESVGMAMAVATFAGVIVQTPAGALVDRLPQKRMMVIVAAILVAVGSLAMIVKTNVYTVVGGQALIGMAGAIFPPVTAAITLGLVGRAKMARRTGRNEAFNHAGNLVAAVLAGVIGTYVAREGIFVLVAVMSVGSIFSVLAIRPGEIDHGVARGSDDSAQGARPSRFRDLVGDRRIVTFFAATVLFHFANAAMLPLVGQRLSVGKAEGAAAYMSACIVIAQLVMIPVATWAGRRAHTWGRRPVFLVGFAILPLRGMLYVLSDNPYYLVAVQALDGIGAGIFGVLVVLVVADLTRGTGRFNLAQGALATATGLGASASTVLAGVVVQRWGFNAGFLGLAAIAAGALGLFYLAMPETRPDDETAPAD